MDELDFYKKQYAYLMGEIDRALSALDAENAPYARLCLLSALETAERRWLDAHPDESAL